MTSIISSFVVAFSFLTIGNTTSAAPTSNVCAANATNTSETAIVSEVSDDTESVTDLINQIIDDPDTFEADAQEITDPDTISALDEIMESESRASDYTVTGNNVGKIDTSRITDQLYKVYDTAKEKIYFLKTVFDGEHLKDSTGNEAADCIILYIAEATGKAAGKATTIILIQAEVPSEIAEEAGEHVYVIVRNGTHYTLYYVTEKTGIDDKIADLLSSAKSAASSAGAEVVELVHKGANTVSDAATSCVATVSDLWEALLKKVA